MLLAAGVLFYVSYWLISQSESRRWLDFLKRQAQRGVELGGRGTLALTAFLAVYREGAETALMYQAMLGSQGQSRAGLVGPGRRPGGRAAGPGGRRPGDPRHERPAAAPGLLPVQRRGALRAWRSSSRATRSSSSRSPACSRRPTSPARAVGSAREFRCSASIPTSRPSRSRASCLTGAVLALVLMLTDRPKARRQGLGRGASGKRPGDANVLRRWAGPLITILIGGGVALLLVLNLNLADSAATLDGWAAGHGTASAGAADRGEARGLPRVSHRR